MRTLALPALAGPLVLFSGCRQPPTLVESSPAPEEACPTDGEQIRVGADDGDGGGTAGDGQLQEGEVDDAVVVCDDACAL